MHKHESNRRVCQDISFIVELTLSHLRIELSTLILIDNLLSPVQSANAFSPMLVTLCGMVLYYVI